MKIAVAQWRIRPISSFEDFAEHLRELVHQARGTDLLLLPECFSLELLALAGVLPYPEEARWLASKWLDILATLKSVAEESGLAIVGGSHFQPLADGRILNTTPIVSRDGEIRLQPKNKLTAFERDDWRISAGEGLADTGQFRTGVMICYDSEFPEGARVLAERGVGLIAVPAFTETRRGFQRVRWSCLARAVENQVFVAHASLVGSLGREPVPNAVGTSGVFAPSVEPFPESAVLAECPWNEEAVVVADLDFDLLEQARASGDVRNWYDRDPSCWTKDGT